MSSNPSQSIAQSANVEEYARNRQPFWVRSPEHFLSAHKGVILFELFQARQAGKMTTLSKFVARYLDSLPADLPDDILQKITQLVIAEWEKQAATKPAELVEI